MRGRAFTRHHRYKAFNKKSATNYRDPKQNNSKRKYDSDKKVEKEKPTKEDTEEMW